VKIWITHGHIDLICVPQLPDSGASLAAPNGGYVRASADQR